MDNRVDYSDKRSSIDRNVAIVGIGCRYPNDVNNVRDFWEMLKSGLDCTKPHPKERLDPSFIYPFYSDDDDDVLPMPGKIYCRSAGYLSQSLTGFDRLFFQMSPDEANHMDPQLRLLLEVVWESLEDFGVNVADLRQSDTGVYVGVMAKEYSTLVSVPDMHINKYTASGNNSNMMSNRISYQFDFQGPSITYDTACSSSMYAIHHACEAIRNGDCNLALAGGVNLFLLPSTFVALCQARMLSPDGKCKSFDSSADGYARGEGAGIIVLKPLQQAIEHRDRIYAVIKGGALNNDGKTSGITAPSTQSQMELLKRTYEITNVSPQEVPYVEAHGTGTQAGDKAEATALGRVLGNGREVKHPPLIVGSVKSNFGHTEGAAGVAGVIKTSLVLQYKKIPSLLHFRKRNKNVDCRITFPTQLMDWPEGAKYIAGCSSFGFGGANAHLVLEAAPTVRRSCSPTNKYLPTLLLISAASKDALNKRASDWLKFLHDSTDDEFWDIVRTAATRATHHPYRLAICCQSRQHAHKVIEERRNSPAEAQDVFAEGRVQNLPSDHQPTLVFVFSGMGTQWWGMGRQLMKVNDVFRGIIVAADNLLREFGADWSLQTLLTTETNMEKINDTAIAQPSICALQIALAEVYRHLGILPHAVIGHSVGEVAAACVSGYITFRDAMNLIYIRGKLLKSTAGKGAMAAILLNTNEVKEKLSEFRGKIDIACVNSPTQTVISGNVDAIEKVVDYFKVKGHKCVTLKVQNAFHSFQQEEIKATFLKATGKKCFQNQTHNGNKKYSPRQVPMVSTVNAEFLTPKELNNNQYWWKNIRETVNFEESLRKLFEKGYNTFLEIGAHPALAPAIKSTMASFSDYTETLFHEDFSVLGSLRRPKSLSQPPKDENNILMSIAKLYVQGYPLNLEMLFPDEPFNVVSLPKYPWLRQDCTAITDVAKSLYITPRVAHPLLGESVVLFHDESDRVDRRLWKSTYNLGSLPWLPHHNIENVIILPGAAYIEMMLNVAKDILEEPHVVTLQNVQFHKFHDSPDCIGCLNTDAAKSHTSSQWQISVRTFNENNQLWAQNATCSLVMSSKNVLSDKLSINEDQIRKTWKQVTRQPFYEKLAENGIGIGNSFQAVSEAFYNFERQESLVYATMPKVLEKELIDYVFHPSLLDAVFQSVVGFTFEKNSISFGGNVQVPKSVGNVTVHGKAPSSISIYGHVVVEKSSKSVNVTIANSEDGKIFAKLENVKFAKLGSNINHDGVQAWEKEWTPVVQKKSSLRFHDKQLLPINSKTEEHYLVISDNCGVADLFYNSLLGAGISRDVVKVCKISQDTNIQAFCKNKNCIQNIIVLTFMNDSNFISLDDISKEQFFRSQINDPMSLMKTITDLHSERDTSNVSFWIITKGAVIASKSDISVNPLMSNGYSLVMNFMNDFPELAMTNLDLPLEQSIEASVQWLSAFFLQPERSENYLALRHSGVTRKDKSCFSLFSPRLKFKPTSSISFNKNSDNWMIDISTGIRKIRVKPAKPSNDSSSYETDKPCTTSEIIIQVMAFSRQYRKNVSRSTKREVGFLFGGTVQKGPNHFEKTKNVLGYKRCNKVTSIVKGKPGEVVPIPPNVGINEALLLVQIYLPLYLALQETFRMPGEQVVMFTSDNTNLGVHLAFGKRITSLKDINVVKVIIYVQAAHKPIDLCTNHGNVIVTTAESLQTEVSNSSVDTLLIHSDFVLRSKESEKLFSKVRCFGTVTTLGETLFGNSAIKARQIGTRVVDLEHMWASDNNDRTNQLIGSLLEFFTKNDHVSETITQLVKNKNFDKVPIIEDQAIDDRSFDIKLWQTKPTFKVCFAYSDAEKLFSVDPISAYLVVGGTKGIGVEIARWLVNRGAMNVYISGRTAPEKQILQELSQGREQCNVKYIACDITDEKDTEKLLLSIRSKGKVPLSIFHCAAVFDDQRIEKVSQEAWAKVLLPKAYGLFLLHKFTTKLEMPIKDFVCFSSIVHYLGNAGQGSYCSANTFLHSLCQARRLRNLPATVIAPGAIGEVGFAARTGFDKQWENRGMRTLSPSEVIHSLSWSLGTNTQEFGFSGALNLETFMTGKSELFQSKERNRFSMFKNEFPLKKFSSTLDKSSSVFASLNEAEAINTVDKFLVDFLRQRLGLEEDVPKGLPLSSFGFDSAMSWELSSLIRSKFNVVVSSVELLNDSTNVSKISSVILSKASQKSATENVSASKRIISTNALWLHEPREMKTSRADLFCFPPTGKGSTLFAEWGELFMCKGIRVVVAQLPGWEGRENEPTSHDLGFLVKILSEAIIARTPPPRVGFFGCGIGSLLAFEIARHLQAEHKFTINHIFICGWYPPSTPYTCAMELNVLGKKRPTLANNGHKEITFLDNRDVRQIHVPRKVFQNIKASETICKSYRYVPSEPLQCNMTMFSGVRDTILTQRVLMEWKNEIDTEKDFDNVTFPTDHKLLGNKKYNGDIAVHVRRSLLKIKASHSNHEATEY